MGRNRVFTPRWDVALTDSMASAIKIAAANQGITRSEWIRQACQQRLDRDDRDHRRRRRRAAS